MVSQAADIVTNDGLDLGSVVVEVDETDDAEEHRIARYTANGCSCKLDNGRPCHATFTPAQYRAMHDECRELTHDQLDLIIKGQLRALTQHDEITQKSKAKNTERIRSSTQFRIGGHRVCIKTFCFVHAISRNKFNAIKASWVEDGLLPRQRKRSIPHNALKLSDVEYVVRFILRYAEDNAILLPGRIPGYKSDNLQLLPSSTTKREVWESYHLAASNSDVRAIGYSLFCDLWKQLTPTVVITRPMSDLCWTCQQNSTLIMRAHNRPGEEKSEVNSIHNYYFV